MKRIISIILCGVLWTNLIYAQAQKGTALTVDLPERNNFSPERLARVDQLIKAAVDSGWIAGAIGLVAKNGHIVYHKAIGYDDKENNKLLQKDAIFRIASQTKAITSVAVMMLYDQGKLLLDDPISKYIPEFKKPKVLDKFEKKDSTYTVVAAKREITIRDLLTHTSGIGYAQIGDATMNAVYGKAGVVGGIGLKGGLLSENIKKLAVLPLFHQPGEKWTYGLNTDVLGYLVEIVSGLSLNDYFRKNIFEPLGMKDTYFYIPQAKRNRLAMLYTEDKEHHLIKAPELMKVNADFYRDYPNQDNGTFYSGGGGLVSTAYDYAIFMQMLLNGGNYKGKHILSRHTVSLMTVNQIGDLTTGKVNTKFGLGFELITKDNYPKILGSVGTFSWGGMFSSKYWIDPEEKIVAQFVLQLFPNSHSEIHDKIKVLVYQALE